MNSGDKNIKIDNCRNDLIKLIHNTKAYVEKERWLYLNYLWYKYDDRRKFSSIALDYLSSVTNWTNQHVILILESTASTYGLVPIITYAADELKCKLAIWRETVPVSISESWFYPSRLDSELTCVIVQGVVSRGSSLRRVVTDINYVNWKVDKFVVFVQDDNNSLSYQESLSHFKTKIQNIGDFDDFSLLKFSDIR